MNFNSFNLHERILANVQTLGFQTPTPIQQKTIPSIIENRDVMGLAQTGTGKTAAFVLPILNRLMSGDRGYVRALIIAPTRELAEQIHKSIIELGKGCKLRSITIYGGTHMGRQIQGLRHGAEIVVACPGRLLDHVERRTIDLKNLEVLVLDEADQMFDMGFLPSIRQILKIVPENRQTLLFSATMPNAIRELAHDILTDPVKVQIGHSAPATTVKQAIFPVPQHLKTPLLLKILETTDKKSVLIFTRTKHKAKQVADQLNHAGYHATSLQGNLSQNMRKRALDGFRNGKLQILVATDIASRGIDISSISHVINYDMPDTVEAYTHRIGRTGRAAKTGDAYSLLARDEMSRLRSIERVLGKKLEQRKIDDFDYHAKGSGHATDSHARDFHGHDSHHRESRGRDSRRRDSQGRDFHARDRQPRRDSDRSHSHRHDSSHRSEKQHNDKHRDNSHARTRFQEDRPRRSHEDRVHHAREERPRHRHESRSQHSREDRPQRSASSHQQQHRRPETKVYVKSKKSFKHSTNHM